MRTTENRQKANNKMADLIADILFILNVSGLNTSDDRGWQSGLKKTNHDLNICSLQGTHFKHSDIGRLK